MDTPPLGFASHLAVITTIAGVAAKAVIYPLVLWPRADGSYRVPRRLQGVLAFVGGVVIGVIGAVVAAEAVLPSVASALVGVLGARVAHEATAPRA